MQLDQPDLYNVVLWVEWMNYIQYIYSMYIARKWVGVIGGVVWIQCIIERVGARECYI